MRDWIRQIFAVVCLVALVCGGQASACACDIAPPAVACDSHGHGGDSRHGGESGHDSDSRHGGDSRHDGSSRHGGESRHGGDGSHDHSAPGDCTQCPCATCHSCTHVPVALSAVQFPCLLIMQATVAMESSPRLLPRIDEIFIPPKLA